MPDFDINVEFEVWCSCGNGLCNQSTTDNRGRNLSVTVEPCKNCLDSKYDEGYSDGFDEAKDKFEEME